MQNIFFDLDGTLTDPKLGIIGCIRHALRALNQPEPDDDSELEWCIGPPLLDSFRSLIDNSYDAKKALEAYRERFSKIGLYENEVYPAIPQVLADLRSRDLHLFVATSKPTIYAKRILDHFQLSEIFDEICGSELDGTRSNKTELFGWILSNNELKATDTVMVGDRSHDIIGAVNNEMKSIGVLYGYGSEDELRDAGASELCEQPVHLVPSLKNML